MRFLQKIGFPTLAIIALLANGCKEVGPSIDLTNGKHNVLIDTTYVESTLQAAENKNVLIELFTGVSCINCPAAHVTLDNVIAANPGRVFGIAMHSTAEPASQDELPPGARQNLGSADAQTIVAHYGEPGARPVGAVDRVVHSATFLNSIFDIAGNFNGYTSTQLAKTTPVNMTLTSTYDASARSGVILTELHYTTAQPDSDKLTIYLIEDSIVTSQLQADNSDDTNYVHNDIMRVAVTNALGDRINTTLTAGTVVKKAYTYTVDAAWRPEHMRLIAFVHRFAGSDEILQVKDVKLQ
ncbi:MAG: Omp28-related outer membrane protein [Bacteroidetes bacterium]|nr:Omp28-related outer membrane protein [Bacteroidota bacterium]MBS1685702.1 Omp28-related outer membrane protein [Bacteroidota bacterium]